MLYLTRDSGMYSLKACPRVGPLEIIHGASDSALMLTLRALQMLVLLLLLLLLY